MTAQEAPMVTVRLIRFPLDLAAESTEHFEGLKREFALLAMRAPESAEVPKRLLDLVAALTDRYAGLTEATNRERDEAIARGETVSDELSYTVPPAVADACVDLASMLDDADEYCRQGELLLTLATPPQLVAFRRWYLGEFVAQLQGEPPLPWTEADHEALARSPRLRGAGEG